MPLNWPCSARSTTMPTLPSRPGIQPPSLPTNPLILILFGRSQPDSIFQPSGVALNLFILAHSYCLTRTGILDPHITMEGIFLLRKSTSSHGAYGISGKAAACRASLPSFARALRVRILTVLLSFFPLFFPGSAASIP